MRRYHIGSGMGREEIEIVHKGVGGRVEREQDVTRRDGE